MSLQYKDTSTPAYDFGLFSDIIVAIGKWTITAAKRI